MAALMTMHTQCLERLNRVESRLSAPVQVLPTLETSTLVVTTPVDSATVVAAPIITAPVVPASSTLTGSAGASVMRSSEADVLIPALGVTSVPAGERTGPNQLDDHVSSLSRQKIESNCYIELAGLLAERALHGDEAVQRVVLSKEGVLSVAPKEPVGGKFLSYLMWTQAWNVYMTVYIRKFPNQILDLVKYMDIIRSLHQRGVDWAKYDGAFRRARANWPTHYPWAVLNAELFLSAQQSAFLSEHQSSDRRPAATAVPDGYCRLYHTDGVFCGSKSCRYKHTCPTCQRSHPQYICNSESLSALKRPWVTSDARKSPPGPGKGAKRT